MKVSAEHTSSTGREPAECAPVLFLIFNRPDVTARVFQRIREARPARLYVAADGPRLERAGEFEQCSLAKAATEHIDWPCKVFRLYREANMGCKLAVSSAINWFFVHEEQGIILEDDCLPDLTFFRFASEMLNRYAYDDRIMMVSGDNFLKGATATKDSYYFTKFTHIWGWATWRRAWNLYDVELSKWKRNDPAISSLLTDPALLFRFEQVFEQVARGLIDTWDYQLAHACMIHNGANIMPSRNLIKNIGFDSRATHTQSAEEWIAKLEVEPMSFPLRHPSEIKYDELADQQTAANVFLPQKCSAWRRLLKKFRK